MLLVSNQKKALENMKICVVNDLTYVQLIFRLKNYTKDRKWDIHHCSTPATDCLYYIVISRNYMSEYVFEVLLIVTAIIIALGLFLIMVAH